MSSVNFLAGARDFTIGHATLVTQNPDSSSAALRYLAGKAMPGSMLDSAERSYPPRCDPDTRQRLRSRVIDWGTGIPEDWRLLWLSGPAGVGKSAVAQSVAEEFRDMGRLGAAIFFSRPNHRDDPNAIIPTIVYQLAIKLPQYKHIITQRLADDPLIFDKNHRAQFRELIIDPFSILMTLHQQSVSEPLLIVMDGLDECSSRAAQREFVEIIGRHACLVAKFPLIWMICSRPEPHLKIAFSNPDRPITCHRERLDIDDDEARQDGWRMLHRGFAEIRRNYDDQLESNWPPSIHLRTIANIASGHLGFIAFILRFISDEEYSDPCNQLEVCMSFLQQRVEDGAVNPLKALDLLYHQILSDIPPKDLPTTMCILGATILYSRPDFAAQNLANFLELSQASFYRSLQHLHSVIYVPPAFKAYLEPLRIYHASFSDYLTNAHRSGSFYLDEGMVHYTIALKSIQWQRIAIHILRGTVLPLLTLLLAFTSRSCIDPFAQVPRFHWLPSPNDWDTQLSSLNKYAAMTGWIACRLIPDTRVQEIIAELTNFDFNDLDPLSVDAFVRFSRWLYCQDNTSDLISIITEDHQHESVNNAVDNPPNEYRRINHTTADLDEFVEPFSSALGPPESQYPESVKIKVRIGKHKPAFFLFVLRQWALPPSWSIPSPSPSPSQSPSPPNNHYIPYSQRSSPSPSPQMRGHPLFIQRVIEEELMPLTVTEFTTNQVVPSDSHSLP